ncbi:MAG: response regulator [Chitinispirillaceae bacterium]|nr:response regulator [Chitinispirillaceae bacterium]
MNNEKKKILLVDDEEVILFGYRQVLSEPWLQVDTASTVPEAEDLANKSSYAAAIIDMRLSSSTDLEGLALVPFFKKNHKECRIIVLTAYGDDTIRSRAIEAGADLFLEKPVDPDSLKRALASLGIH